MVFSLSFYKTSAASKWFLIYLLIFHDSLPYDVIKKPKYPTAFIGDMFYFPKLYPTNNSLKVYHPPQKNHYVVYNPFKKKTILFWVHEHNYA